MPSENNNLERIRFLQEPKDADRSCASNDSARKGFLLWSSGYSKLEAAWFDMRKLSSPLGPSSSSLRGFDNVFALECLHERLKLANLDKGTMSWIKI